MAKCNTCINKGYKICVGCTSNPDIELGDWYVKATPELVSQKMITDYIDLSISDNFKKDFKKANQLTSSDIPKLMAVYAREYNMIATDGYILCELFCGNIPNLLQNKYILKIEPISPDRSRVYFCTRDKVFNIPMNYSKLFDHQYTLPMINNDQLRSTWTWKKYEPDLVEFIRFGFTFSRENTIVLLKKYFEKALELLGDITYISYTNNSRPVIFQSNIGRVAIAPVVKCQECISSY